MSCTLVESNSTDLHLLASGTYTGAPYYDLQPDLLVALKTDQDGTLYVDFGIDGINWDSTITFNVTASTYEIHRLIKGARWIRIRYVNGSSNQSYLRLSTSTGSFSALSSPLSLSTQQDADAVLVKTVSAESLIAEGKFSNRKYVNKFGKNSDVDAGGEDIWDGGGAYTGFPTSAAEEFQVLSSDPNDAAAGTGARTVRVYYLNSDYEAFDSSGNELYFDVSLNGITAVNSGITGMRVWRAYVLTAGSGTTNAGTITVRWRTTTSVVFTVMPIGEAQSHITAYCVPAGYSLWIKRVRAYMLDSGANQARLEYWVREFGGAVREIRDFAISTAYPTNIDILGGVKFPAKTDVVFQCTAINNANGYICVEWDGEIVKD